MKKIEVWRTKTQSRYEFEAHSLDELINKLSALKNEIGGSAMLEIDVWDDNMEIYWRYKTEETDDEYNQRLIEKAKMREREKERKAKALEEEKELFKKLKEKYEPKVENE